MKLLHLCAQFSVWSGDFDPRCNLLNWHCHYRPGGDVPCSVPGAELCTAGGIDNSTKSHQSMRRSTHGAVLSGSVDGGRGALLFGKMAGRPPRDGKLRVLRLIAARDAIAIGEELMALSIDKYGPERFVAGLKRLAR